MRLALLSNVTVDLLAGMIKKTTTVYLAAGFDTWQQEIFLPTSGLYDFEPEAVVVLIHAGAFEWEDKLSGKQTIDEWCAALGVLSSKLPGVPLFVSSIDICGSVRYGAELRIELFLENYFIENIQTMHDSGESIYLLPVKECIEALGRDNFYSPKMWYIGLMPYSMKGLAALSGLIIRYTSVAKGMYKKCLVVDLDNTLWGGVIGEDGVEGILLSGYKEGARYKAVQRILKKMKNQGVMLAILSKNNANDVEPVFSHPDMILQHEDFVAEIMDWEPKSRNIRKLATSLNIGLDAFVFLDDNPVEREAMRAECPEVAVIDFPKDSSLLPAVVEEAYENYFLTLEVTGEDLKKTAMYRAERKRNAERYSAVSANDFLKNLEMTMDIHRMKAGEEKRVVQLINKTNQFNVTTKRYGEEKIHELAEDREFDIITVHMADKYGDQGLVAVLILKYEGSEEECKPVDSGNRAEIDTFLMSCRVMGRNAEDEIMARIKDMMRQKGIATVRATYIKTSKNAPVAELFDRQGFTLIGDTQTEKRYEAGIEDLPTSTDVFKAVTEDWR